MTPQEIFDKVVDWITRPEARRSYDPDAILGSSDGVSRGLCLYEMEIDGVVQKCAVGCLLSDEDLDRSMRSFKGNVFSLFEEYGTPEYLEDVPVRLLSELQYVHDSESHWADGGKGAFNAPDELQRVAEDFGLVYVP